MSAPIRDIAKRPTAAGIASWASWGCHVPRTTLSPSDATSAAVASANSAHTRAGRPFGRSDEAGRSTACGAELTFESFLFGPVGPRGAATGTGAGATGPDGVVASP